MEGIRIIGHDPDLEYNYAYFPVQIDKDCPAGSRDEVYDKLRQHQIRPRKYFYPLISHIPEYAKLGSALPANLPVAEQAAKEILCLPIYPDLEISAVDYICELIIAKK